MGRKTVLLDDLDGTELPDDAQPVTLSLGRTTYSIYLTEKNHGKLMDALTPFIENAEKVGAVRAASPRTGSSSADKEKMKQVRAWAQSTGFTFKDAAGNDKTLGDRGRIPDEVVEAYDAAN